MRRRGLWIIGFAFLLLLAWPRPAHAAATSCNFSGSPSVSFGNYDVYGPAIASTGTISGVCTNGGSTVRPVITLSKGHATTYHPRKMNCFSGACLTNFSTDFISYNLYTSATHATIWGDPTVDATTASVTMPSGCCTTNTAWSTTVYGFIPAAVAGGANDVAVGTYTDTIVVTMTF